MGVSTHIQNQMMMSGRLLLITVSCFAALAKAGNIAEELTAAGATTLVDFVVKAGLAETLSGPGPFTVFAPDNAAFAKLPADLVATLSGDTELLKKVLLFHVLSGNVMSKDVTNDLSVASVEGTELRANVYLQSKFYDGFVTINGKRVYKTDIVADNGVIHMVSDVIYPFPTGNIAEVVTGDERFSTLLAAVVAAELTDTLASGGPFTLFAPTNDAFAKIPTEALDALLADKDALSKVLLRHVVPGTLFYNGITWDILGTAGGVEDDMIATQRFRAGVLKVVSAVNTQELVGELFMPIFWQPMESFMQSTRHLKGLHHNMCLYINLIV